MQSALKNMEAIKLHLVQSNNFDNRAQETVSLEELIEYLLESLEEADNASCNKAENLLVRIGNPTIPFLLKGLKSAHSQVKSVCAMVLIRIGRPMVNDLKGFYLRQNQPQKIQWMVAFILGELGEELPTIEQDDSADNILTFSQAV